MSTPARPATTPYAVAVEQGKDYWWCSCGLSANQPFCDGAHKPTAMTPVKYTAAADTTVYFCGCKSSAAGALCDGAHKTLAA